MIKEVTLINYKSEIYKVYIDNRVLYFVTKKCVTEVAKDVLGFDLKVKDESILISYYDKTYSIYIVNIDCKLNNEEKIKKSIVISTGKIVRKIDYLTLVVSKDNKIILIFRGKDKCKEISYILTSYNLSNNLSIVTTSDSKSYNTPFISYSYNNKEFLFISEKYSEGKYILYDLTENRKVSSLYLPNITNISFVKYKNKPIIFYNKIDDIDILLKHRDLGIDGESKILKEETSIALPNNIFKPQVSVYNEYVYVVWIKGNVRYTALSKDLRAWQVKEANIKDGYFVKANIFKGDSSELQVIKTYLNNNLIKKYKDSKLNSKDIERVKKEKNKNSMLYSELVKDRFDNLYNLVQLEEKYNKRYEQSLKRIEELESIIEEKDRCIIKLLDIK